MLRARECRSGDCVVVKIALIPDVLRVEQIALEWVGAHGGPVPVVRTASTVGLRDGRRAACLVTDHVDGCAPESNGGWQRMGRTLAALTMLPWTACGLPVYDPMSFGWVPGPTELRWWLTAAGAQFAHRRLRRAGQPGVLPRQDAITVLGNALRDDRDWMPD